MKTNQIPSHEPIAYEMNNTKNQVFVKWAKPILLDSSPIQTINIQNYNPMPFILDFSQNENIREIHFRTSFDTELLHIAHNGIIQDIEFLKGDDEVKKLQCIDTSLLLMPTAGFCNTYHIEALKSSIKIMIPFRFNTDKESDAVYKPEIKDPNQLSELILSEKDRKELRSSMPSRYVWYHDLLFLVSEICFPSKAASKPMDEENREVINILQNNGVQPILRAAAYPSIFFSRHHEITKGWTWWGMENIGKFLWNGQ